MTVPSTTPEFMEAVVRSGVLERSRLEDYLRQHGPSIRTDPPSQSAQQMVQAGLLTSFQAQNLLAGKWKGFVIADKFRLLDRIGKGGMGHVFLCEHLTLRRRVALKVLSPEKARDPILVERFQREGQAAACLHHPNIIQAYDIGKQNEMHYLVLEYVEGMNLHDFVQRNGPLDPVRACHYVRQVALGLQHAHEQGLIHRDIKPANLLLDREGVIKILDLGLARFSDSTDQLTQRANANAVLGTADFLAPEQALDSNVDIRADIYGMGTTFYYLLTGNGPFPEGNLMKKLYYHQTLQPDPPSVRRPDLPPELDEIILRMLAKQPDDRYQTPIEVAQALEPWAQQPTSPPTETELPLRSGPSSAPGSTHYRVTPPRTGVPASPGSCSTASGPRSASLVDMNLSWCRTPPSAADDTATGKQGNRPTQPIPSSARLPATPSDQAVPAPARNKEKTRPCANAFLWTAGILLLTGLATVAWILLIK